MDAQRASSIVQRRAKPRKQMRLSTDQLQPLQARVPLLDDEVVVHGDAQRATESSEWDEALKRCDKHCSRRCSATPGRPTRRSWPGARWRGCRERKANVDCRT
jgi:hypothetical protein